MKKWKAEKWDFEKSGNKTLNIFNSWKNLPGSTTMALDRISQTRIDNVHPGNVWVPNLDYIKIDFCVVHGYYI